MLKSEGLKRYYTLGELFKDYRTKKDLSQAQLAELLDVDNVEQISRWERGTSIRGLRAVEIARKLAIPYQVISNLNQEVPIPIYYDLGNSTYSLGRNMAVKGSFTEPGDTMPLELSGIEYIETLRKQRELGKGINHEWIKRSIEWLPELNFCLVPTNNHNLFSGISCVLPLQYDSYRKMENKWLNDEGIEGSDLDHDLSSRPRVFYMYMIYGDSLETSYNVLSKVFEYFSTFEDGQYIVLTRAHDNKNRSLFETLGLHAAQPLRLRKKLGTDIFRKAKLSDIDEQNFYSDSHQSFYNPLYQDDHKVSQSGLLMSGDFTRYMSRYF